MRQSWWLLCIGMMFVIGCTEKTAGYCDESTPCPDGQHCDTPNKICVDDGGDDIGIGDLGGDGSSKLANGESCGQDGDLCTSGHCVDGVCCAEASCDECNACNISGMEGACAATNEDQSCGADHECVNAIEKVWTCQNGVCKADETACAPFSCNQSKTMCLTTCTDDTACGDDGYCDLTTSSCVPKKNNGVDCEAGNQCESGLCTQDEKVCCDRACDGECESCKGMSECTIKAKDTPCGSIADVCLDGASASVSTLYRCNGNDAICTKYDNDCGAYKCLDGKSCRTSCDHHLQCTSGVCQLNTSLSNLNSCVDDSEVCYVKEGAAAPGGGTKVSPHPALESCLPKKNLHHIAIADGTYPLTEGDITINHGAGLQIVGYQSPRDITDFIAPGINVVIKSVDANSKRDIRIEWTNASDIVRVEGVTFKDVYIGGDHGTLHANTSIFDNTLLNFTYSDIDLDNIISMMGTMAVRLEMGDLTIKDSVFGVHSSQSLFLDGGGALTIRDTVFVACTKAIQNYRMTVDIDRTTFEIAPVYFSGSQVTGNISNSLFTRASVAGLNLASGASVTLNFTTFFSNNGANEEVICDSNSTGLIYNSIIWNGANNAAYSGCSVYNSTVSLVGAKCSNCSNSDPLFVNETNSADLSLQSNSPAIDKGNASTPDVIPNPATVSGTYTYYDLDKKPRYYGSGVDHGCYEYSP